MLFRSEIGCTIKPVKYKDAEAQAMVLYDSAAGGAGFSIQTQEFLVNLLKNAKKKAVECGCDKACHRCLVDYSTQHALELLDRRKVVEFLDDDFFARLVLPVEFQIFDKDNRKELRPLIAAIERSLLHSVSSEVSLYLTREDLSDLNQWIFSGVIYNWIREKCINLVFIDDGDEKLTIPEQISLYWLTQHPRIKFCKRITPISSHVLLKAEVRFDDEVQAWGFLKDFESQLITGRNASPELVELVLEVHTRPEKVGTVSIHKELNGLVKAFGAQFWNKVLKRSDLFLKKMQSNQLISIEYTDRYLAAPLPFSLCLNTIIAIISHYKGCCVTINTGRFSSSNRPQETVYDNWADETERSHVVKECIKQTGLNVVFNSINKHNMPHARTMSLTFDDESTVTIWLDQGFGYWWVDRQDPQNLLPATWDAAKQAEEIIKGSWVLNSGQYPTAVFFSID